LRFEVSHAGRTEAGPVDSHIHIAPIDPAMIAARPPAAGGCRETREAYRAALQASTACTTDADCTSLPAPSIAGESASCAIYVNKSAPAATFAGLDAQWDAACVSASDWCVAPSRPVCNAGACADPCVGLALPMCAQPCGVDYDSMSTPTACQAGFSCQQPDGLLCTCGADAFLACRPVPLVHASCPIGCLPAKQTERRSNPPPPIPDAGVTDAGSGPADATAGGNDGSDSNDARTDGAAADAPEAGLDSGQTG
jgi:hypothetical protein